MRLAGANKSRGAKMTNEQAKTTVAEITTDVLERRGDMSLSQVRRWTGAYSYWAGAVEVLTAEEVEEAMYVGLRVFTDALADQHEEAMYEEEGEAAFGRED